MKAIHYLVFLSITTLCSSALQATTIAPYQNLALMGQAADAVVMAKAVRNYEVTDGNMVRYRTTLQIINPIKGTLQLNQTIEIQNHHLRIGELERTVWGDLELTESQTYLLFVSQLSNELWQPQMLSYGAFQQSEHDGKQLLIPFGLGTEVQIVDRNNIEVLGVYYSDQLITLLRNSIDNTTLWDRSLAISPYSVEQLRNTFGRAANPPSHCTFLAGAPYARWDGMENTPLPVRYHVDGDAGCNNIASRIGTTISRINSSYDDVDLINAGTHNFAPSCAGQGATDGQFTSWVNNNLGGSRNLVIQFDDPCSEITDLNGCNGTIAFGGLYWSSQRYTVNGETYRYAAYGYVVVNNGTGTCLGCNQGNGSDYVAMLTHEIGHSLNAGHIAGRGTANMNPNCCVNISALDQACLAFSYSSAALPVEVVDFWGEAAEVTINLEWQSVSESGNDFYTIEKLMDGVYLPIGKVTGAGESVRRIYYDFVDPQPIPGTNYYRLSQTDYDGSTRVVKTIAVPFLKEADVIIAPNPIHGHALTATITSKDNQEVQLTVLDAMGNRMISQHNRVTAGDNHVVVNLESVSSGVYQLVIRHSNTQQVLRFVKGT
ncbi:MAG: T9SS type A sorting domain-containing protein [Saprospiraceae bacterium]|nr:T9SS type A sorting domain-containing protein [Saprospiraceae bacterium]